MNVSLTPELENFVIEKTRSGLYNSASEVMRQALRALMLVESQNSAQIARLNRDIEEGFLDLEQGRVTPGEIVFANLRKKNSERL